MEIISPNKEGIDIIVKKILKGDIVVVPKRDNHVLIGGWYNVLPNVTMASFIWLAMYDKAPKLAKWRVI